MSTMSERLYPSSAPTASADVPEAAGTPAPHGLYAEPAKPAERSDTPADVRELRKADPTRRLFDAGKSFAQALPDDTMPGYDHGEARQVVADLGAEPDDVRMLAALHKAADAAADDDVAGWHAESLDLIKRQGISSTDLDLARQLVARDPRVRSYLDRSGLGNHPKVVERVVALARRARLAGQL